MAYSGIAKIILTGFLQLLVCFSAAAAEFACSDKQVQLIELFTSEGCSSCPPADRWISTLKQDPGLWREFIPLAFHVDYWDYIGWKDQFADPAYSARQRRYASERSVSTVYTPGFLVDGQEWRGWFRREPRPKPVNRPGALKLRLDGNLAKIEFLPHIALDSPKASVALLGTNFSVAVKAGENRGRQLSHEFVVLRLEEIALVRDGERYLGELKIAATDHPAAAVAAWVSTNSALAPVQATGGWLQSDTEFSR